MANALSRRRKYGITTLLTSQKPLLKDIRKLDLEVVTEDVKTRLASLSLQPTLLERMKKEQKEDQEGRRIIEPIESGRKKELRADENECIRCGDRLWVP